VAPVLVAGFVEEVVGYGPAMLPLMPARD